MVRVEDERRTYRREHPFVAWFSVGIVLTSAVAIAHPPAVESPATALPVWIRDLFYVTWGVGAALALGGLWRMRFDFEAAGMILLGTGLLAYTVTIIAKASPPLGSLVFLWALTVGALHRGVYLASRTGRVNRAVRASNGRLERTRRDD